MLGDFQNKFLRASALNQEFLSVDPSGRDEVLRHGLRSSTTVCFEWDGFKGFQDLARDQIQSLAQLIEPNATISDEPGQIELTRMGDGGFFHKHIDGDYPGAQETSKLAFIHYLGDRSSFSGGELSIVGEKVDPDDNSLVVFKGSHLPHEVLPISGKDALRLTINGYFVLCLSAS